MTDSTTTFATPEALRSAAEVLSAVLHDAQRKLAGEAAAVSRERDAEIPPKPTPAPFVDLTPYLGMPDVDVLRALGARNRNEISYHKKFLRQELQSGSFRAVPDAERCRAGLPTRLFLRCTKRALPDQPWCRTHHPRPPVMSESEGEQTRARLRRDQLWQRPDGRVLEALYELADRVEDLCEIARAEQERLLRLQTASAERANPEWLNATEAAEYARRPKSAILSAAAVGELSGARNSGRGPWSFRPADVDRWLESGRYGSGRYARPITPRRRRS